MANGDEGIEAEDEHMECSALEIFKKLVNEVVGHYGEDMMHDEQVKNEYFRCSQEQINIKKLSIYKDTMQECPKNQKLYEKNLEQYKGIIQSGNA